MLWGCERSTTQAKRTVFFRGEAVASLIESSDASTRQQIKRVTRLNDELITLSATLDAEGFATTAVSDRPGRRHIELKAGGLIVDDHGHQLKVLGPVLLAELVHRVRIIGHKRATLVDLCAAETLEVTVERRGPEVVVVDDAGQIIIRALPEGLRIGPGVFAEGDAVPALPLSPVEVELPGLLTLKGKVLGGAARHVQRPGAATTARHLAPGLFIESDDAAVQELAEPCAVSALADAWRVAEIVHPLVDATKVDEPPSAAGMLRHGGDCDGAAALVTAALRSCGHPARAVVGYKLTAAGTSRARLVPHAVAEVYSDGLWTKVDATVPAIGSLDDVFFPVAEGLGGTLTMGRVLGVVDAQDVVDDAGRAAGPR